MLVGSLSYQLPCLQKQASAARDHICKLEETLAGEPDNFHKMLNSKEQEMTEVRNAMQEQLRVYQELLDIKLALNMEINAYCKLLEGQGGEAEVVPQPFITSHHLLCYLEQQQQRWHVCEAGLGQAPVAGD